MARDKFWQKIESYIADRLTILDNRCRPTKASGGNCNEDGDIFFSKNIGTHWECKATEKNKNPTIKEDVWLKVLGEIPMHVEKIPILAIENKNKRRWAVLDLDDFLEMYIDYYKLKNGE